MLLPPWKGMERGGEHFCNTKDSLVFLFLFLFSHSYIFHRMHSIYFNVKIFCSFFFFLMFQETFDAGLQAFQQEGIANITALKDQLLAAKHIQSKAIEARHASLMKRWNQLLANSAARKKKLLEAQEHFRKVSSQTMRLQKWNCSLWRKTNKQHLQLM